MQLLRISLAAAGALIIGACGAGSDTPTATRASTTAATATPTSKAGAAGKPWHLARRPVVVLWQQGNPPPPSYEVYFRLDRPLPRNKDAVVVSLEGVTNDNTNGLGYDESTPERCYAKGIDSVDDYPRSLRHARAGDLVTLRLRFLRGAKNVITRRVPLQLARPDEAGPPVANPVWLRLLGCTP